ncbi:DNA topoisomerase, partial [Mycobacterium sp. ITM-2017-0098]
YGLATLLCDHVTVRSGAVVFDYPAKSGVQRYIEIDDPEVVRTSARTVRQDGRPDRLLVCRNSSGDDWIDLRADDVNARFKELVGDEYT